MKNQKKKKVKVISQKNKNLNNIYFILIEYLYFLYNIKIK